MPTTLINNIASHNVMQIGKYIKNNAEITDITKKINVCASEQYELRYLSSSRIKVIFVRATTVMLFVFERFAIKKVLAVAISVSELS